MRALPAARIVAELHLADMRAGLRTLAGAPVAPAAPRDDGLIVPAWDEDIDYLGGGETVTMDAKGLGEFLARSHADDDLAARRAAMEEIDDNRLMEMLAQTGGASRE